MASAATTSIRTVVNKITLKTLSVTNLSRMLGTYEAIGNNAVAMFATGKFIDIIKDNIDIKKKVQDIINSAISDLKNTLQLEDPLSLKIKMSGYIDRLHLCVNDSARSVDESSLRDEQKDFYLRYLLNISPIAQRPMGVVQIDRMAKLIELALYLVWLLENDYLVTVPAHGVAFGVQRPMGSRLPINASPLDTKNYPKPVKPSAGFGYFGEEKYIDIRRPEKIVEDRIDELCSKLFKIDGAYSSGFSAGIRGLAIAEKLLTRLSNVLTPLQPLVVKS